MLRTVDVTDLAQRAMLGGLLLDPTHLREVNSWIRGSDLSDPWHRTTWVLIREAQVAGHPLDATGLGAALVDRLGPADAHLIKVHDLLAAVGRDPDPRPAARVLVDAGARRDIAGQGVLIEAAALGAAMSHEARYLHSSLRIAGAGFLIAGERWADANGQHSDHLVDRLPCQLRAGAADLELRRAADKFLSDAPGPDPAEVRFNEQRLVACLATHPTAIGPTNDWLRPDRLTNRPWATVYAALVQLADAGGAIDPSSLMATTLRISRRTKTAPDLGDLLQAIENEQSSVPGHLRQAVAGDHLRMLAAHGTAALRRGASDPETSVPDLLDTGTVLVQSLAHLGRALPDHLDVGATRTRDIDPPAPGVGREGPVAG